MARRPAAPPDPPLADAVVELRPVEARDVPAIVVGLNGDADLAYWLDGLPQPYAESDARAYLERAAAAWRGEALETPFAICAAGAGELIGVCGVKWNDPPQGVAELGYWLGRGARGRGLMTRAVRLLAGWVLGELAFDRLEIRADTRNAGSIAVAERAGFVREGTIRSARANARDGRRVDHALYSFLRDELQPRSRS